VVGLDKTTMVTTVDALERRGLVRREQHPDDRRIRLVAVTAEGKRLVERATAVAEQVQHQVLAAVPEEDRDRLVPLLRALVAAAPSGPGSCV
jgi:DNA-binding MarR family transcriptional regulator